MRIVLTGVLACALGVGSGCASAPQPGAEKLRHVEVRPAELELTSGVAALLATQPSRAWPFGKAQWLDEGAVRTDVARIETFLAERGHFSPEVRSRVSRVEGEVDVEFAVTPGRQAEIVSVSLLGADVLSSELRAALTQAIAPLAVGAGYSQSAYLTAKNELERLLHEQGHAEAQVYGTVFVDKAKAQVLVRFELAPGPIVHLGALDAQGLGPIPESAVTRAAAWEPGQRYSPQLIKDTETALYRLGVFASVRLVLPGLEDAASGPASGPTDSNEPLAPPRPVTAQLEVAKLHELRLGGGIGAERRRQEVRLLGEWRVRNFLGGLRTFELSLQPAYAVIPAVWDLKRHGFAFETLARVVQPDLFGSRIDAYVSLGYELGIQEGYQFHGPNVRLGVERPFFSRKLKLGVAWTLQYLSFFNIDSAAFLAEETPLGLGGFRPQYRLGYLEEYVQLDLRDDAIDPTRGGFFELRAEQGAFFLAGDFDYLKLTPEVRGYLPLGARVVLAARAAFGVLLPLRENDSPVTRRYRLGGPSSHRGFSVARLSVQAPSEVPGNEAIPIGSNAELLLSLDVRVRVVKLFGSWLAMGAFADAGDAPASLALLNPLKLHVAVGPSVSYDTPIGSVRVALGVRLNRLEAPEPDAGQRFAFHLSLGAAF